MVAKRIAVVGAGGLAREVEWLLREINAWKPQWEFAGYVVSDPSSSGAHDARERVLGDFGALGSQRVEAAVIGIGTPAARLKVARELSVRYPGLEWPSLIHPSARIDLSTASIGQGVVVTAGVIGTVNLTLGPHAFINLACTLGHEAIIGEGCVLNPTANISGGVKLGAGVLIGTGAQVLQYLEVGDAAVVGAGAVVTRNVDAGVTVVGAPAKPLVR